MSPVILSNALGPYRLKICPPPGRITSAHSGRFRAGREGAELQLCTQDRMATTTKNAKSRVTSHQGGWAPGHEE